MPFASEIHYRRAAKDSKGRIPLVLIHGAGGSYLYWPPAIRHLAGEDVLAIDLPGHGTSAGEGKETIDAYVSDVIGFMDNLSITRAVITGHSMGSAIAMRMSLVYPERVKGLILIGSGAKLSVHPKLIQYCGSENTYPDAVSLVMEWAFDSQTDRRLVELAGERMAEMSPHVLHADFIACDAFDVRNQVGEIEQPTLVISCENDQMTPVRFSQFLAENLINSRLEVVPKAGHMVMLEQPETVANLIEGFLTKINSGE
jgi:pimeloyl-ACP methyl ester carboxylesterase